MRTRLIKKALFLVVGIFIFNLLAYMFYWYASVWWYDMVMHTAGGIFLACLIGARFSKHLLKERTWQTIVTLLLGVFVIGLFWEYFEYIVQFLLKPVAFANIPDSISDLLCDMAGGIIGTFFVLREKKRYNSANDTIKNA
jgi:uncharacterized membrane protein